MNENLRLIIKFIRKDAGYYKVYFYTYGFSFHSNVFSV